MKKRVRTKKTYAESKKKRIEPQKLLSYILALTMILGLAAAFISCQKGETPPGEEALPSASGDSEPTGEVSEDPAPTEGAEEPVVEATTAIIYDTFDPEISIDPELIRVHYTWPQTFHFFDLPETAEERALAGALLTAPLRAVRGEEGLSYVPELLSQLPEVSEDGLTVTLTFRNAPLSPDGVTVTAKDYHDYLKEVMSARRHNPLAEAIIADLGIVGALPYYQGAQRNNTNPTELAQMREQLLNDLRHFRQQGEEKTEPLGLELFTAEELAADPLEGSEAVLTGREELIDALRKWQLLQRRNLGARINQRAYDALGQKRPLWASVGIKLIGDEAEPALLELQFERPLTPLKLSQALSQFGLLAYRGGLERKDFDPMLDRTVAEDDLTYLQGLGWQTPSVYQIDTISEKSLVLKKDPGHVNAAFCGPDVLHFRRFDSAQAEMEAFIDGALDTYCYHGQYDLDRAHPGLRTMPGALWAVYMNENPLSSAIASPLGLDMRLALAQAVDRRQLMGDHLPQCQETTVLLSSAIRDPFVPQRAFRDVLVAKGNEAPNGGLDRLGAENHFQTALQLSQTTEASYRLIYLAGSQALEEVVTRLKQQWEAAFGEALKIELVALEAAEFWRSMRTGDLDMALAPVPQNPFDALETFAPLGEVAYQNWAASVSQDVVQSYQELAGQEGILTPEDWYNGLAQLERKVLDEGVLLPLFTTTDYLVLAETSLDVGASYLPDLDYRTY